MKRDEQTQIPETTIKASTESAITKTPLTNKKKMIGLGLIFFFFIVGISTYRVLENQGNDVRSDAKNTTTKEVTISPTSIQIAAPSMSVSAPPSPEQPHVEKNYAVHKYNNSDISLENIKMIGVYFIAKGNEGIIRPTWKEDMIEVLKEVEMFYEKEFQGKSNIRVVHAPIVIGKKEYSEYQYLSEITDEIKVRVLNPSGDMYNDELARLTKDEYESLMVFIDYTPEDIQNSPVNSFGAWDGVGTMGAFWLEKEARTTYNYGSQGSAHEFGHTLGIPHPWEDLELNPSGNNEYGKDYGNVMGYIFGSRPLKEGFIMPEQKAKLGIK